MFTPSLVWQYLVGSVNDPSPLLSDNILLADDIDLSPLSSDNPLLMSWGEVFKVSPYYVPTAIVMASRNILRRLSSLAGKDLASTKAKQLFVTRTLFCIWRTVPLAARKSVDSPILVAPPPDCGSFISVQRCRRSHQNEGPFSCANLRCFHYCRSIANSKLLKNSLRIIKC